MNVNTTSSSSSGGSNSMFNTNNRRTNNNNKTKVNNVLSSLFGSKYGLLLLNITLLLLMYTNTLRQSTDYSYHNTDGGRITNIANGLSSTSSSGGADKPCPTVDDDANTDTIVTTPLATNTAAVVVASDNYDIDSSTATVMAMATGYSLLDYQHFVGSLRKTGFKGNIILAVAPILEKDIELYLLSKNVIIKKVQYSKCNHENIKKALQNKTLDEIDNSHDRELVTCLYPYSNLKHRWARFPLLRDYLIECGGHPDPEKQCGGPVLITDMRDTIFQRNPFDKESIIGLQVFQEFYTVRTTHWLVDWPVGDCKNVHYDEPMLCSGTTIGTRNAMIDYLNIMQIEMYEWMSHPICCCFDTNGDDQSMHNYLYYSGKLNNTSIRGGVTSIINRMGIINTVGAQASLILHSHTENKKALHDAKNEYSGNSHNDPYDLSRDEDGKDKPKSHLERKNWLGLQYGLTDIDGYFLDMNGQRSYAVHQYDRFGGNYYDWINKNKYKLFLDDNE